jgi:integrase
MSIYSDERGRLHVQIMVEGKRIHRTLKAGATQGDAKRVEAQLRLAVGKDAKQVSIPGDPPMAKIVELYTQHYGLSHDGEDYAALRMVPWAKKYRASEAREFAAHVVKDMCKKIKDEKTGELRPAYAAATINRSLATIKKGLSLAWDQNLIPENYGLRIKPLAVNNKREVFLSVEQVRSIAQHCTPQIQAIIWAALLTGARRGELLKLEAVYISDDTITLTSQTTKTKRTRVVPIVPALRPWLQYFPVSVNFEGVKSAWRRAREKASLEHVNFHDLRHSCASILLAHGVDLYTIGRILGHAHTNTTQRYAHLQVAEQRAALDKLSHVVLPQKLPEGQTPQTSVEPPKK